MFNRKPNILVVDDMPENAHILSTILSGDGYSVTASVNGYDALRVAKKKEFELIFLDIMMPDISGIEVCRYLKAEAETANIPVIFLTASDDKEVLEKAFRAGGVDYIKKPYFKEELLSRTRAIIKIRQYEKGLEEEVRKRTKEMREAQIHLMRMLGGIAEGHSLETYQHIKRVSEVVYLLARYYGFDEQKAEMLKHASYLHDIGKIGIKDFILHKSGELTKKEFEEIKKHPKLGSAMLKGVKLPLFKMAQIVSEQHHEKWDGSGYPNGYKAEEIHVYARIVAIADVFDALSSNRSYKKGWNLEKILEFLKHQKRKHFDPNLIDIFFKHLDEFLALYNMSQKDIGVQIKKDNSDEIKRSWIKKWLINRL